MPSDSTANAIRDTLRSPNVMGARPVAADSTRGTRPPAGKSLARRIGRALVAPPDGADVPTGILSWLALWAE